MPGAGSEAPRVRLVVLNHDGGAKILRCFEHLHTLDWPRDRLDLVLVDNASTDPSTDAVEARFGDVRTIRLGRNEGFPGNDHAMRRLDEVDYVGLVNDDAYVSRGFLAPLVEALEADPGLGAACPKMLFDHRAIDVGVEVEARSPGRGDPRLLGVALEGVRVDGIDRSRQARIREGGHGPEVSRRGTYEWTGPRALIQIPVERDGSELYPPGQGSEPAASEGERRPTVELLLRALEPTSATLSSGGISRMVDVGPIAHWVEAPVGRDVYDVVNNAGSLVLDDGHGVDRGFGDPDDGRWDRSDEVFAWCGGAVLLRAEYLSDVGLLARPLFLYYEDTDLSWRGRARGWRYRYVPGSVVHHSHAATSVEGSPRFSYFTERNRLLMLLRNAPAALVGDEVRRYLGETYDAARRDVAGALLQGRRPNPTPVVRRLRALAGAKVLAPWGLASRTVLRARQTVPDWQLLEGLTRRDEPLPPP